MANYVFLDEIHIGIHKNPIHVKILQKWLHRSTPTDTITKLILADAKGVKIEASIKNDHIGKFQEFLVKSKWISISTFIVNHVMEQRDLTTTHPYAISFLSYSVVQPSVTISNSSFIDLVDFDEIQNGVIEKKYRVDIIGKIVSVDEFYVRHERTEDNKFGDWAFYSWQLEDEYGIKMEVLAMGDHALKFYKEYKKRDITKPQICVLRWMHMNTTNPETAVQTLGECSEILLNPDMLEVNQFLQRIIIDLDGYESSGEDTE